MSLTSSISVTLKMDQYEVDLINYAVVRKLCHRAEQGHKKYGVTMERDDLGMLNWLQHLQEELLDAAVYIEKVMRVVEEQNTKEDQSPRENPPQ